MLQSVDRRGNWEGVLLLGVSVLASVFTSSPSTIVQAERVDGPSPEERRANGSRATSSVIVHNEKELKIFSYRPLFLQHDIAHEVALQSFAPHPFRRGAFRKFSQYKADGGEVNVQDQVGGWVDVRDRFGVWGW